MTRLEPLRVDVLVVIVVLTAWGFAAGLMLGEDRTRDGYAKRCEPQGGQRLISTHQSRDGVECVFTANAYGLATTRRKATK